MNTKAVAQALSTLSLAIGELAEALDEQPVERKVFFNEQPAVVGTSAGVAGAVGGSPRPAAPDLPEIPPVNEEDVEWDDEPIRGRAAPMEPPTAPQGSAAVCPKHRKAYRDGRYGKYCSQKSDDPAWSKNGFCSITPKNAHVWLQAQAA